jgi:hypothetical protein
MKKLDSTDTSIQAFPLGKRFGVRGCVNYISSTLIEKPLFSSNLKGELIYFSPPYRGARKYYFRLFKNNNPK